LKTGGKTGGYRLRLYQGVRVFWKPWGDGPFGAPHVYQRERLVAKYFTLFMSVWRCTKSRILR